MLPAAIAISKMVTAAIQYLRPEVARLAAGNTVTDDPDRLPGVRPEVKSAADAEPELAATGCPEAEGAAVTEADPEAGVVTAVLALTPELLPESSSRFSRFKSARISEAT